jgi:mono/diheme cytochrome c family protein
MVSASLTQGPDYDLCPMSRLAKILVGVSAAVALAAVTAACGTEKISVPKTQASAYRGAVIFSERCAGCHTLSYAGTHGSAPNIRTAQAISGPNFDTRCERPVTRVLYAIENGGFSGAYMPQNVVVGQDALDVAKFVATYAGRAAPKEIGIVQCVDKPLGTLPPGSGSTDVATTPASTTTTTAASASATISSATKSPPTKPATKKFGAHKKPAHS